MKGSTKVLLVEDDRAIADLYALKLRLDGYHVSVAHDIGSAERLFQLGQPDVVCLDHWLPGGPGLDLARRLSRLGAVVILLTNDQLCFEQPPSGVRSLLKVHTSPGCLSRIIHELTLTHGRARPEPPHGAASEALPMAAAWN
jgi:CheY-like chemotaxis protein